MTCFIGCAGGRARPRRRCVLAATAAGLRAAITATVISLLVSVSALPADALFPKPLHLTRRIDDPISRKTSIVDEYCMGNRVVTVGRDRVIIIDYDRQEITDIDRAAATYSITRFDEVAKARAALAPKETNANARASAGSAATALGSRRSSAGRPVDTYEIRDDASGQAVQIGIDRTVVLSRASLDVLLGAAYPGRPAAHHDAVVNAASAPGMRLRAQSASAGSVVEPSYGLPAEQSATYDFEGRKITVTSAVTRVGDEVISPDLLLIPPGAKRVESRATALPRLVDELDPRPHP